MFNNRIDCYAKSNQKNSTAKQEYKLMYKGDITKCGFQALKKNIIYPNLSCQHPMLSAKRDNLRSFRYKKAKATIFPISLVSQL